MIYMIWWCGGENKNKMKMCVCLGLFVAFQNKKTFVTLRTKSTPTLETFEHTPSPLLLKL